MRISYRVFWMPKAGSTKEEYEDAFAPEAPSDPDQTGIVETREFSCAVADGATETSFSGQWAKILCDAYCQKILLSDEKALSSLQSAWLTQVSGKELPWYAEEKLSSGAFSTIAGLTLSETESQKKEIQWRVSAFGDSCFFLIRNGDLLCSMPMTKWEDFNYNPALLSTRKESNEGFEQSWSSNSGTCQSGDLLYLMTDAISKWFLHRHSIRSDATDILEKLADGSEFAAFVDSQRAEKDTEGRPMMPNDDVTWIRISLS